MTNGHNDLLAFINGGVMMVVLLQISLFSAKFTNKANDGYDVQYNKSILLF